MKAYKCDRCLKLTTSVETISGKSRVLFAIFRPFYYPEDYHLCDECSRKITDIIKEHIPWTEELTMEVKG